MVVPQQLIPSSPSLTSVGRVSHAFLWRFFRFSGTIIYSLPASKRRLTCPIWSSGCGDIDIFVFWGSLREIGRCEASKVCLPSSFLSLITLYYLYPSPHPSLWSALWLFCNTIPPPHTPSTHFPSFPPIQPSLPSQPYTHFGALDPSFSVPFQLKWFAQPFSCYLHFYPSCYLHFQSFSLFSAHPLYHYPINLLIL